MRLSVWAIAYISLFLFPAVCISQGNIMCEANRGFDNSTNVDPKKFREACYKCIDKISNHSGFSFIYNIPKPTIITDAVDGDAKAWGCKKCKGAAIEWDMDTKVCDDPCVILAHELRHAYQHTSGNYPEGFTVCGTPFAEVESVSYENLYRVLENDCCCPRTSYGSCPLPDPLELIEKEAPHLIPTIKANCLNGSNSSANAVGLHRATFCEEEPPSVYFVATGTMAHDPVGTRVYVEEEGTSINWEASIPDASTSNSTGSAFVTGNGANNQATIDFDITYEGGGTTGLGYNGGIQVWITGEIGQRYRFKWDATWTITNQGGPNSYAEWNNRKESGEFNYDKTFTIDGYNREVDIPGVGKVPYVFVFDFPRETQAGVWGIVNAFGGSVKARVEISVEFLD